jgi:hypothetical protein
MTTPINAAPGPRADSAEPPIWTPAMAPDIAPDAAETVPGSEVELARVTRPQVRVRPRRSSSVTVLLAVSALIAVGGIGFAVGRVATPVGTGTTGQNANGGQFGPNASGIPGNLGSFRPDGSGGFGSGMTSISGTLVSVSADSFTVKLASGETVTIATGSSTTYHNQTSGLSTDLATGETVTVQTSSASTGSNASSSSSPGTGTRTATDVTITSK